MLGDQLAAGARALPAAPDAARGLRDPGRSSRSSASALALATFALAGRPGAGRRDGRCRWSAPGSSPPSRPGAAVRFETSRRVRVAVIGSPGLAIGLAARAALRRHPLLRGRRLGRRRPTDDRAGRGRPATARLPRPGARGRQAARGRPARPLDRPVRRGRRAPPLPPRGLRAGRGELPRPAGAADRGEPALRGPARPRPARPVELGLVPVPAPPPLQGRLAGLQARLRPDRRRRDADRARAGAGGLRDRRQAHRRRPDLLPPAPGRGGRPRVRDDQAALDAGRRRERRRPAGRRPRTSASPRSAGSCGACTSTRCRSCGTCCAAR